MTTLHMDTESVHSLSLDIRQKVEQMREQARSASDLGQSVDWMGPSRDEFIFDLEQLTQTIQTQLDAGLVLADRIERETIEWETTASTLAGDYGRLVDILRAIKVPSLSWIVPGVFALGSQAAVLGISTTANEPLITGGGTAGLAEYETMYQKMN